MTPKQKQNTKYALTVTFSLGALTPVLAWLVPRIAPLFDAKYAAGWMAALALTFLVFGVALVMLAIRFITTFGEVGEDLVESIRSDRRTQDHNRDITEQLTQIRKLIQDTQHKESA